MSEQTKTSDEQRIPNGMLQEKHPINMWRIAAIDEEKRLLEIMRVQIEAGSRLMGFLEVSIGADGAGAAVSQIVNKKLTAERRTTS